MSNYHYIQWNNREIELLISMRKKGYSFYKIANEFGVTTESVKQQYRKVKPIKTKRQLFKEFNYYI